MDDLDSDWQRKGATLSDKTARKEFGLTQAEIVRAIRAGSLHYRSNSIFGNPFLRLLRREVEALVKKKHGDSYLKDRQVKLELAQINRELKRLKTQINELEERKSKLLAAQGPARDYLRVLALTLVIDEAEGYAYVRQVDELDAGDGNDDQPRLIPRRQLRYPVSLLLVLPRNRLAKHDALAGDTRLVLTLEQIVELIRTFLPASANDARLTDRIEQHIARVEDLGFLARLQPTELSYGGSCPSRPPPYGGLTRESTTASASVSTALRSATISAPGRRRLAG